MEAVKQMDSDFWLNKAKKALDRNDLHAVETRIHISLHIRSSPRAEEFVRSYNTYLLFNTYANTTTNKTKTLDSNDSKMCILIAKLAIKNEDYVKAKKFLNFAKNSCPKAVEMLKEVDALEKSKENAYMIYQHASMEFELDNFDKAKRMLVRAQKLYYNPAAANLLQTIRDKKANTGKNDTTGDSEKISQCFHSILTCFFTCAWFRGFFRGNLDRSVPQARTSNDNGTDSTNNARQESGHGSSGNNAPNDASDKRNSSFYSFSGQNIDANSSATSSTANTSNGARNNNTQDGKKKNEQNDLRDTSRDNASEEELLIERLLLAKDDYQRLGLPDTATAEEVNSAFRKLSLRLHPDKNVAPRAKEAFMVIVAAKERLLGRLQ